MKNKLIKHKCIIPGIFALLTIPAVFSGCGTLDFNTEDSVSGNGTLDEQQAQPALTELEQSILQYEEKYAAGDMDAADMRTLAELYSQAGQIRRQRDILEQAYRLFEDEEALRGLENLTVNLAEEDETIKETAMQLYNNLSIDGYLNDGIGILCGNEWFFTMMPKLSVGYRRYYLENEDGSTLCMEIGYNENGVPYSSVWLTRSDDGLLYLQKQADSVYLLQTNLTDGAYQGAYESWLCLAASGDVYHEQGFFENGVSTGSYDCRVYFGSDASDLLSLWSNREAFSFTSYYGEFDSLGRTMLTQPASLPDGEVIYAYDASGKKYLTMHAEDPSQAVFDSALWGLKTYPVFVPYHADTLNLSAGSDNAQPQIRIYDANIEWFDGKIWHIIGPVEEFASADPFWPQDGSFSASIPQKEYTGTEDGATGAGRGNAEASTEKPAASSQPSSSKPASSSGSAGTTPQAPASQGTAQQPSGEGASQTPAPGETTPQTPTPDPTPSPTPTPDPTPTPTPTPDPTPTPTPTPDPAPTPGGSSDGSDIEWSPDLE